MSHAPDGQTVDQWPADDRDGTPPDPTAPATPVLLDRRVRVVFDASLEGLLVVDDDRRYLRINRSAARILGAPPDQIIGRRIEDFTPPEHRGRLEELWDAFRRDGELEGPYEVLQGSGGRLSIVFRAKWDFAPGEHLIAAIDAPQLPASGPREPLTRRECEILQLAAGGNSNEAIASQLVLSPTTVKTHLQNIYRKLGARDRASAVAIALRTGLIR